MTNALEKLIEDTLVRGQEEGRVEGRQKGRAEEEMVGFRKAVRHAIERRFGQAPTMANRAPASNGGRWYRIRMHISRCRIRSSAHLPISMTDGGKVGSACSMWRSPHVTHVSLSKRHRVSGNAKPSVLARYMEWSTSAIVRCCGAGFRRISAGGREESGANGGASASEARR
jgi:hypothetical protein